MKRILLFFSLLMTSFLGYSQTKGINYQAVIIDPTPIEIPGKDVSAQPYVNKEVWLRFTITQDGVPQYQEIQKTKTDEYGLVNLIIGTGINTGIGGTFASLNWEGNVRTIVTHVSFDKGSKYTEVGNQKLNYVPYSLYTETANKLAGVLPIASGGTGAVTSTAARANLGLDKVDNTSDLGKPVSTATLAILDTKEAIANKSTNIIADSASSVKYPTVKAIKDYIDSRNSVLASLANRANLADKAKALETPRTINGIPFDGTANITIPVGVTPPDASATVKGLVQLAGDLAGNAGAPRIAADAVNTSKIADGAVTDAKIATVSGSKVTGNIAGNAATATLATSANTATKLTTARNINGTPFDGTSDITIIANASTLSGTVAVANGGTGATTAAGARTNLGLVIGTDVLAQRTFGTAANSAATDFVAATEKGANNGVATLGVNGKIPSTQIPAISFQSVSVVNSDATMTAISGAQVGSIAIRSDQNINYVLSALPATTLSNWIQLAASTDVSTINGLVGPSVNLTTNEIPEGTTNKYFTDARVRGAISATAPLNYNASTGVLSMTAASANSSGYLSAADFATFNNKQTALTAGVDYATPSGNITGNAANVTGIVSIANGGTGTSTATGALITLGAEPSDNKSNNILVDGNSITKFPTFKAIKDYVDQQSANAGVADNSITSAKINGTLAVLKGGTGAANAADARTNLGLVIGTDVMAANFTTTLTGDVTGSGNGSFATTVNSVGGVSASTIATLPGLITTNATAITTEATTARAAELTLTNSVNANTASITANTNAIAANTASIATNATAITTEATTARAAELTLTNSVNANTASITANTNAIAANTVSITANSNDLALKAPLASPAFTGSPTAPTPATSDNSTKVATTEYVKNSIVAANAGLSSIGAISGTSNAKGATISGTTELILTPADITNGGVVTTGAQTFAGAKTFSNTANFLTDITVNGLTVGKGGGNISSNTAIGLGALALNTTGSGSTAFGNKALSKSTAGYATAFGSSALENLTIGTGNVAIGYTALNQTTSQNSNTAVGDQAMRFSTGASNTVLGASALTGVAGQTNGINNTAIGALALRNATTAAFNVGVGSNSLNNLTTGNDNTVLGFLSGFYVGSGNSTNLTSMSQGVLIGSNVRAGSNASTNEVAIGYNVVGNGSNTVTIGNYSNTANYFRGDINLTGNVNGGTWSGTTIGSNYGGAGTVTGILKANGSGVVSAAVAGTDYLSPSGSAALLTNFPTLNQSTTGNAATATALATGRTISTTGDISFTSGAFDGTTDVTGAATLTNTTVTAGTYGSSTAIPTFTVDSKGRLTSASTVGITAGVSTLAYSTTAATNGGTISGTTLTLTVADATNPGLISTGAQTIAGAKTFSNDITAPNFIGDLTGTVTGNLSGTATTATNLSGGVSGSIPYQTASGTTAMIPVGSANQFLTSTGSGTYTWTSTSAVTGNNVPYTGASGAVNLGTYDLTVYGITVGRGAGANINSTVLGYQSLLSNTTGFSNTSMGNSTLKANTTGSWNTAIGNNALAANTGGHNNTAVGLGSLDKLTSGSENIAIGSVAGRYFTGAGSSTLTTSNQSIFIGYDSRAKNNSSTNEIVIGHNTTGNGNNTVTIGNSSNTANYFTGSINLTGNINGGTWSGTTIGSNYGGAGTVNGLLKANGSGVVSAAVSGTDYMAANATTTLTGDVTGTGNGSFATTLANSGVASGTYGSSTAIPTFTVDSKGRLTAASTVGITAGVSTLAYSTTGAANGGTISGTTLTLTAADASNPGLISTGAQTFAGAKTFTNTATFNTDISVNGLTVGRGAGAVASNAALGATALNANTSGNYNVAVGSEALQRNTAGSVNVALGAATIDYLTSGNNNTAVGGFAGRTYGPNGGATGNNTTMNNGILLGYDARPLASGGTDEVVIGMRAIGHGSNTVTLGNSSNTKTYMTGDLDVTGNITSGIWSATEVAVAKGGTGATTAAGARTNLGLAIGTDVMAANFTTTLTGDVTGAGNGSFATTLAASGVTSGTYGSSSTIPVLTVDAKGRVTTASTVSITAGVSTVTAISGTSNANGATISGTAFTLTPADATNGGVITTGTQTFAGSKTFNNNLTVNGYRIGKGGNNINTTIAIGDNALSNNSLSGVDNIAIGSNSLTNASSGTKNIAIGSSSLNALTTGNSNVSIGNNALSSITTNGESVAIGDQALSAATGVANTAVGSGAGVRVSSGASNVLIGAAAAINLTTGTGNVAIGPSAGSGTGTGGVNNVTGANSVFIGRSAQPQNDGQTNQVVLAGFDGSTANSGLGSNTTLIGNSATTLTQLMGALNLPNTTTSTSTTTGALRVGGGVGITENLNVGGATTLVGAATISNTTASSSISTGALVVRGGAGIAGNVYIGGTLSIAGGTPAAGDVLTSDANGLASWAAVSGVSSIGAISGTATSTGATITSGVLNLTPADATNGGVLTAGTQTIGGAKTFSNTTTFLTDISVNGLTVGKGAKNVTSNTVLGVSALGSNSAGTNVVAIGSNSLQAGNNSGNNLTAVGSGSGYYNSTGSNNSYFGYNSGFNNTTGYGNSAIGSESMGSGATTGYGNSALGYRSLYRITGGYGNTALGDSSLLANTTGYYNVGIGHQAMSSNTTGYNNIGLGYISLGSNTTGYQNIGIGRATLYNNGSGINNIAIGFEALSFNGNSGTYNNNIAIGKGAGKYYASYNQPARNLADNIFIGVDAWALTNSDVNSIVIGNTVSTDAGAVGWGSYSTSIGNTLTQKSRIYGALTVIPNTATGVGNSSIIAAQNGGTNSNGGALNLTAGNGDGTGNGGNINLTPGTTGTGTAGKVIVNGGDMTVNGVTVGKGKGNGTTNTAVGTEAMLSNTGGDNTAVGWRSLYANTSGASNSAFGTGTMVANTTGNYNTALGYNVLYLNNASNNTGAGFYAMYYNSSGAYNTAIGGWSAYYNQTGSNNTSVGYRSLYANTATSSSDNTAIGYQALSSSASGGTNTALGSNAGAAITTGAGNTGVGNRALYNSTTGNYNTAVGNSSGPANSTNISTNGIFIGYNAKSSAGTSITDEVVIGANATGNGSNTITIGNSSNQQTYISGAINVTANTAAANMTGTSSTIAAQNATTATYAGGNLNLTAGNAGTTGLGGNIVLTPGTSTTAANKGIVQINGQVQITGGSPGAGEVLVSDANGLATWSNAVGSTVVTSATSYAITLAEAYVFYTGTSAGTFSIPAAAAGNAGKAITIKNKTAFGITITPVSGTIYIDNANAGAASVAVGIEASNNWIKLVSDGTQWNVIRALF